APPPGPGRPPPARRWPAGPAAGPRTRAQAGASLGPPVGSSPAPTAPTPPPPAAASAPRPGPPSPPPPAAWNPGSPPAGHASPGSSSRSTPFRGHHARVPQVGKAVVQRRVPPPRRLLLSCLVVG